MSHPDSPRDAETLRAEIRALEAEAEELEARYLDRVEQLIRAGAIYTLGCVMLILLIGIPLFIIGGLRYMRVNAQALEVGQQLALTRERLEARRRELAELEGEDQTYYVNVTFTPIGNAAKKMLAVTSGIHYIAIRPEAVVTPVMDVTRATADEVVAKLAQADMRAEVLPFDGKRYDLVLLAVGENRPSVARVIRGATGMSQARARRLIDEPRSVVLEGASEAQAERVTQWLETAGASVSRRVRRDGEETVDADETAPAQDAPSA